MTEKKSLSINDKAMCNRRNMSGLHLISRDVCSPRFGCEMYGAYVSRPRKKKL